MSFSRGGKTQTSTSSTATNINTPVNLQDTSGIAIGQAGGAVTVNNTTSDYDAIDKAASIAEESIAEIGAASQGALRFGEDTVNAALAFGQGAFQSAEDSARNALTFGRDFGEAAFGTVEQSLRSVGDAYEGAAAGQLAALETVADLADRNDSRIAQISEGALSTIQESAGSFFDKALAFASSLSAKNQSTLSDTVSALNAVSVENNKSTDQRVAELAEGSQKTILIALGIAVAGVLGFAMFRRG